LKEIVSPQNEMKGEPKEIKNISKEIRSLLRKEMEGEPNKEIIIKLQIKA
jgi:hypothetical protein